MSDLIDIDDDAIERTLTEQADEIERLTADLAIWEGTAGQLDKKLQRLQAKIDAAIEEACDTQPSWEWRCYAMAKALGANFDKPTSRYGIEGELQARVEALERVRDAAAAILRIESLRKAGHQFPQLEQALKDADAEQNKCLHENHPECHCRICRPLERPCGCCSCTEQGESDE